MSASEKPSVRVWPAADGWRWQYRSENGTPQAGCLQGYTRRGDCISALKRVMRGLPAAKISIAEGPAKVAPLPTWGASRKPL